MKQVAYIVFGCALLAAALGAFLVRTSKPDLPASASSTQASVVQRKEIESKPVEPASSALPPSPEEPLQPPATPEPVAQSQESKPLPPQAARPATDSTQPKKKPPIQDPMAREALALVGADPEAELYWYSAINDFSLSAHERQDLIEDLNEDGLSDPKHPTLQDLPLILSRIDLIEDVGPEAMDPVNVRAFQEAYKDLVNLARAAASGGQPE